MRSCPDTDIDPSTTGGGGVDAAPLRFFKILSWGFSLHISAFQ